MSTLREELHKVRARMNKVHLYHWIMKGFSVGLILATAILIYGRLAPVRYLALAAIAMMAIGIAIGAFIGWKTRKTKLDAARKVDREYANDATVAALEAEQYTIASPSIFAGLQQEQAVRLLNEYNETLKNRIPFIHRRAAFIHRIANSTVFGKSKVHSLAANLYITLPVILISFYSRDFFLDKACVNL